MSLTENDLKNIETVIKKNSDDVKDTVEFLIEKSEQNLEIKFDKKFEKLEEDFDKKLEKFEESFDNKLEKLEDRIVTRINTEISDIAETTREVLAKIDNHEQRIVKLETKTSHL